jgi:hypothetical protein
MLTLMGSWFTPDGKILVKGAAVGEAAEVRPNFSWKQVKHSPHTVKSLKRFFAF